MKDSIVLGRAEEGELSVDVNRLVDSRMLIQGNSGGGKSWLLRLLCERAAGKVPMIILDVEGEFASLREKVDAILIGPDGEVPTDLRSAALLARKLPRTATALSIGPATANRTPAAPSTTRSRRRKRSVGAPAASATGWK